MAPPTEAQPTPEQVAASNHRAEMARGLRELADAIEQNDAIPVPYDLTVNTFVETRQEIAAVARAGSWRKVFLEGWFCLDRSFPGGVRLAVNVQRTQVCQRVVVGKMTVPAQPAHEVEQVEWRCEDSLLAPEAA